MRFGRTGYLVLGWAAISVFVAASTLLAAEPTPAVAPAATPSVGPVTDEAPKEGFLGRAGKFFGLGNSGEGEEKAPKEKKERPQKDRYAEGLGLRVESPVTAIRLSDSRNLPVRITLKNEGKKAVLLKFETSQKIEISVKDAAGKPVVRWSEDRAFAQVRSRLLLNPEERAEYDESISLRDLAAGKSYVLDVSVIGYSELSYSVPFTPGK